MDSADTPQSENTRANEIQEMRRNLRDLVALSTMPTVWSRQTATDIAESLADALLSMLRVDLVYIQLKSAGGRLPDTAVRVDGQPDISDRAHEIGRALAPWLNGKLPTQPQVISDPVIGGTLRLVCLPIGYDSERGIAAVGSRHLHFPSERDQLISQVATNQAAMAIAHQNLIDDALQKMQQAVTLEERNRMAREIHDTLAQGLTGIIVQLQVAERSEGDNQTGWRSHVRQARLQAEECLAEARRSVKALRPGVLEGRDLANALKQLLEKMTPSTAILTDFQTQGVAYALPLDVENNLLRIGQEALTNAIRHARASEIRMTLAYETRQVRLCVKDNGCGFDPARPRDGGFGLTGMRERTARIQASLAIVSQPGHGTTVEVIVPITA